MDAPDGEAGAGSVTVVVCACIGTIADAAGTSGSVPNGRVVASSWDLAGWSWHWPVRRLRWLEGSGSPLLEVAYTAHRG